MQTWQAANNPVQAEVCTDRHKEHKQLALLKMSKALRLLKWHTYTSTSWQVSPAQRQVCTRASGLYADID